MSTDSGTTPRSPADAVSRITNRLSGQSSTSASDMLRSLDGRVAACACPNCGAPMAVRRWLMTADCWRCEVSISLNYLWEAERSSKPNRQRPISQASRAKRAAAHPERDPGQSTRRGAPASTVPAKRDIHQSQALAVTAAPALRKTSSAGKDRFETRSAAAVPPRPVPHRHRHWRSLLHELLACLMSVMVHVLLLLLLALLTFSGKSESHPQIQLSLNIDPRRIDGGIPIEREIIQRTGFKVPVTPPPVPEEFPLPDAELWAQEIQEGPRESTANLPPLAEVKADLDSDNQYRRMLSARDPRIRWEIIRQEGGTSLTEAAVARALRWISLHQREDGSWPLDAFHFAPGCHGQCGDAGRVRSGPGGTALALQAMLGAGQSHLTGIYRDQVARGLDYLLHIQTLNGDLRGNTRGSAGMYVQALATIALCDALVMTGENALRAPAQAAVDFIVMAQNKNGGWRYEPRQAGDTSVLGWQLMAMHSAAAARLHVSGSAFLGAETYLDAAQTNPIGAFYAYRPGGPPTPAMTAEGLLSRMYLGWQKSDPGLRAGVRAMSREFPPNPHEPNIYYWYYATQVMHHWGGPRWTDWNRKMRDVLVNSQVTHGHEAGSWDPISPHGHQGGRLYMTALACCTLEVYYRHAPIFRKIDLELTER